MFNEGEIVWFIDDLSIHLGRIIAYSVIFQDNVSQIRYDIDAEIKTFPSHYSKTFHDVQEMYIFRNEEDALAFYKKEVKDKMILKSEDKNTIKISLEYTKEELDELEDAIGICRELLINHIQETGEDENYLDNLDDLISAIAINKKIERYE